MVCLAELHETVVDGLGVGQAVRFPNEPFTGLGQREKSRGLSLADRDGFFRQKLLLLEAPDFALHAAGVALVSELCEVVRRDHAERSDFRKCFELRIANEVGAILQAVG